MVYSDKQWRSFFSSIGNGPWQERADRFATHAVRAKHYEDVYRLLREIFPLRTTAEWEEVLNASDIPHSPLRSLDSLIDDEHLAAVGFFREMDHPSEGKIRLTGIPTRWSESQPGVRMHPPRVGEQSAEILSELGFDAGEIDELRAEKVTL